MKALEAAVAGLLDAMVDVGILVGHNASASDVSNISISSSVDLYTNIRHELWLFFLDMCLLYNL